MELVTGGITAALVGVIIVLGKVIEWFMKRKSSSVAKQASGFNGIGELMTKVDLKTDSLMAGFTEIRQGHMRLMEHIINTEATHKNMVEHLSAMVSSISVVADRLSNVVAKMDRMVDSISILRDQLKK